MVFSIEQLGLLGLFLNTFLSASILPFPSEPGILLAAKFFNSYSVFIVAVIGGFIGAVSNYYIGLKGLHNFLVKREPEKEKKAQKLLDKYGSIVLLAAPWIPFIGDPIMIVVGALRMDFKKFALLAIAARVIKTAALIFFSIKLFSGF